MTQDEIRMAIRVRRKLFFCDSGPGGVNAIECVPVEIDMVGESPVVGVFVPKGVRVVNVDAFLLAGSVDEAATAIAKRNEVLSRLSSSAWKYAANEVRIAKFNAVTGPMGGDGPPPGTLTN